MLLRVKAHQAFAGGTRESRVNRSRGRDEEGNETRRLPRNFDNDERIVEEDLTLRGKISGFFESNSHYIFKFFQVFVYYTVGYFVYHKYEGWTVLQAAYFITQTVTTIGYGNVVATTYVTKVGQIEECCYGHNFFFFSGSRTPTYSWV